MNVGAETKNSNLKVGVFLSKSEAFKFDAKASQQADKCIRMILIVQFLMQYFQKVLGALSIFIDIETFTQI